MLMTSVAAGEVSASAGQGSAELWRWSATRLAHAIATAQISSREAVQSCLDRIAATNPQLNALVEVSAQEALDAAAEADRLVAAGGPLGPLHGVPITTKINSDQAGHVTTNGVVALKDDVAEADSPQVASLRRAGAILVGRSNTPAFSFRWFTTNDVHGRTLNPWNATRTPGGSSGGAASSVAAGMTPIAHGNDIGGSVRYPGYVCGLVALRPTVGRVSSMHRLPQGLDPSPAFPAMGVEGPLARSIEDVRLALRCMDAPDARDPIHVPGATAPPPAPRPLQVGLVRDVGVAAPTSAVNAALDQAAAWLGDAGYVVEEVELPLLAEAYRLWWLLVMEEFRMVMPMVEQFGDDGMKRAAEHYYKVRAELIGEEPGLPDYIRGYGRRATLMRQLSEFMDRYSTILTPVSAEQAFEQDADLVGVDRMREVIAAQWSMMAVPLLGFPGLAVPTGVAGGLPVGVQLIGRRFDEEALLDAGAVIEARAGSLTPIDPIEG
jgi:amidase